MQANLAELDRQLAAQKACQRLSVEGGWYAVLRVPVTRSDEELAIELVREKSVLVHPGHFYDFPSDGYLVLSLITAEGGIRGGDWEGVGVFELVGAGSRVVEERRFSAALGGRQIWALAPAGPKGLP